MASTTEKAGRRSPRVPIQDRGRRKREEILAAALKCFAQTGFRGTDLATVAKAARTSAPHLLYYFGSKEDLVWELVESANAELRDQAVEFYARELTEGLPMLPALGKLIEDNPAAAQLNAVLLAENLTSGALHDHFRKRLRRLRAQFAAMVERGQAAGRIRADVDPEAEAADAIAYLEGLVYHHLVDPKRVSIEAGLRRYIRRVLNDLVIR